MLGTVAMLLVGASALAFRRRRSSGSEMTPDDRSLRRDLGLFLPCFAIGIGLGLINSTSVHIAGAVGLLIAYGAYVRRTVRHSGESEGLDELKSLTFDPSREDQPRNIAIVAQVVVGLLMIVGGAELFVEEVMTVAEVLGISALVLSLVLAPLATELPEKLNSVLWMRRDKDTLAVGNITGAMAFQSTVPIALGLTVTDWDLDRFAVAAGIAGLAGGALALWRLPKDRLGIPVVAAWSALFAGFVAFAALGP
jgi:cation:H+ antiporter